jgi:hypothetical protein
MIPPLPPSRGPGQDGGTASIAPRYEDITQDGRVHLASLMPGVGAAVWRALLSRLPAIDTFRAQGILPILHRLVMVGEDRSVSVNLPIRYEGSFRFARETNGERLFANMWVEARAPIGSTLAPDPPADAPYELVGRIFAEHVITRPFAPPTERKVTRLDAPGVPPIPEDEHPFESAESLLASAESTGAPLEDAGELSFGMMHTDSNQHVNSLVYPRVFEEAVARALMQTARVPAPEHLLARAIELRFRRPFFAGDRARLGFRFMEGGEAAKIAAVGSFTPAGVGVDVPVASKPSCVVKMLFR